MRRFLLVLVTGINLFLWALTPAHADSYCAVSSRCSSLVIDGQTGRVLAESDPDKQVYPASLTKMMTLYLFFEAIHDGRFSLSDSIPISVNAASQDPTRIGLVPGQSINVEDAIEAVAMKSANDIAVAVAEAVGGNEHSFVNQMNIMARHLGMTRTIFRNPSGLPDPQQLTTARDMVRLATRLIHDFPAQRKYFGLQSARIAGKMLTGHNRLLNRGQCTGGKTGYIRASGFNLVAWNVRGNDIIIGAVFGGKSISARDQYMAALLQSKGRAMQAMLPTEQEEKVALISPSVAKPSVPLKKPVVPVPPVKNVKQNQSSMVMSSQGAAPQQVADVASLLNHLDAPAAGSTRPTSDIPEDTLLVIDEADLSETSKLPSKNIDSIVAQTNLAQSVVPPTLSITQPLNGEGDYDDRVEDIKKASPSAWSIQVGAYKSKDMALAALQKANALLPALGPGYTHGAPLTSRSGSVYRAQLTGFKEQNARRACAYLLQQKQQCLVLSPKKS